MGYLWGVGIRFAIQGRFINEISTINLDCILVDNSFSIERYRE
jgi:hypothetical protein